MRLRLVLLSVAALAVVGLAGWLMLRQPRQVPLQVETAEVTIGSIRREVMVAGRIQPARTVDVGAQVSGTIASLHADFNSNVRTGQIVARLDPSAYEARLVEAQAGVTKARGEHARIQVAHDDARLKLERTEALAVAGQVPAAELDLARNTARQAAADLKAADAAIAAAEAAVTEARVSLAHTTVRSPIDGIVVSRHVDAGQTLSASVDAPVLFTIADLGRMQVLAEVAEADVGGIQPGERVTVQIEALGGQAFQGTVSAVRLQPLVDSAAASTTTVAAATAVATSGTATSPETSSSAATRTASPASAATTGSRTSASGASAGAGSGSGQQMSAPTGSTASSSQIANPGAAGGGVVAYTAVIDVNTLRGYVPPGSTALITLPGLRLDEVIRIPNNALTFAPSAAALAAARQPRPVLEAPAQTHNSQSSHGTRRGYVWKFENGRFMPIAVVTGAADDAWTELVSGQVRPGDALLRSAVPSK